jgi:predicted TIM-barrel fold metal-dependent hydrolase
MRVDIHQHLWTEPLVAALARRSEPPFVRRIEGEWVLRIPGEPEWALQPATLDLEARAAEVRRDGVDRALVALSSPTGIEALPAGEARPLVEAHLEGVAAAPRCFAAWGALALDDARPAEVDDLLDRGFVGLSLPAGAIATPAGLERCGPLLERLERRGAPLFVHPGPAPWRAPVAHPGGAPLWWPALTGYVAEMNAAWHAFTALGRREHPHLRVAFAMLAGGAPLHLERLAARGGPTGGATDPDIYYDTSSYGDRTVDAMIRCVGIDQIVYGSDRPVVGPAPWALGQAARHAALVENPGRLLAGSQAPAPARAYA